jgi:hypothetical protein
MNTPNSPMLRWILGQGTATIACEIDQNPDRTFALRIMPSWEQTGIVNHCTDVVDAIKRHAEVAGLLRDSGWRVIARTSSRRHIAA